MEDTSIFPRPSDHSPRATYWTERRCEENRLEGPDNDNYSGAAEILKKLSLNSSFRFYFVSFLYSFLTISDILAHNDMLDKDAFAIEKLRISCKLKLSK